MVSCFRLRMRFVVLRPQVFETDVGIFLRGGQACMAEQLLNSPEIGSPLQQMRRKTVTQRVGSQATAGGQQPSGFLNETLHVSSVQPVPADAHE